MLDASSNVLLDTLIRPTRLIPPEAAAIHGIDDEMVSSAPTFMDVLPQLRQLLAGRLVIIYNAAYDLRLLRQSARAHGLSGMDGEFEYHCAMEAYAMFYGDWNDYHQSYTWQSLSNAAQQCGLALPENVHRARADTELTRQVVQYMAVSRIVR